MQTIKSLFQKHKLLSFVVVGLLIIVVLAVIVSIATSSENDGIEGDSSREYDASLAADQKALSENEAFKISDYLPIISESPSYQISYLLDTDSMGDYTFKLTLSALSASSRDTMVTRLLTENFGKYDPLDYEIELLNYYNPFTGYSLEDLKSNNLPSGFTKSNLYAFGESPYTVQTLTHSLYDGSTNTYRFILENGEPKTMPKLFYTYSDLSFLDQQMVRSLNSLQ
ncbi:hypothetical protein IK146_01665 [Candidatus Saccharibacteria bacterium]|nr:hypothetical protein [Candidatus Saccharibacteria bacterium]